MITYKRFGIKLPKKRWYIIAKENKPLHVTSSMETYSEIPEDTQEQFIRNAMGELETDYTESCIKTYPNDVPYRQKYQMILTKDIKEWLDDEEIRQFSVNIK